MEAAAAPYAFSFTDFVCTGGDKVLQLPAIKLCAAKVTSFSGDARQALDLCRYGFRGAVGLDQPGLDQPGPSILGPNAHAGLTAILPHPGAPSNWPSLGRSRTLRSWPRFSGASRQRLALVASRGGRCRSPPTAQAPLACVSFQRGARLGPGATHPQPASAPENAADCPFAPRTLPHGSGGAQGRARATLAIGAARVPEDLPSFPLS